MAYEMVMPYHLHMPSYFLETFTEYPYLNFVLIGSSYVCFMNKKNRYHRKKRMPVLFIEKEYFILIGLMLL